MRTTLLLLVPCALVGCSSGSSASDAGYYRFDLGSHDGGSTASDSGTSQFDMGLPPEMERPIDFGAPASGARWVYVANPSQNHVAVIDSATLTIHTIEAGDAPTYLAVLPGADTAIVLNVGSHDATVLRTDSSGATSARTVPTILDANRISIAPDGRHAVVWRDTSAGAPGSGTLGTGSFQDVTFLSLSDAGDTAVNVTCGFRPRDVQFTADGATAFIVSEDGVSIGTFATVTAPRILDLTPIGDVASMPVSNDVSVTSDGLYALARRDGDTGLRLIRLADANVYTVDLSAVPTDLDVSPDGTFALAVVRDLSTLVRIPIPDGFMDPSLIVTTTLDTGTIGSVTISPDGRRAVLYTTAAPIDELTVVDLGPMPAEPRAVRLRKAVRTVALAPDGATALVVHTKAPGSPDDTSVDLATRIDRSYGYTMVDLGTGFAKLQLTRAEVGPLALAPDGSYAFTFLRDDAAAVRDLERISLLSFFVDDFALGSAPLSIGIAPATTRVFVGEDYPEGRIAFLDWTTGTLRSVTGYELNGRIVR